jgi:hypothetical protein
MSNALDLFWFVFNFNLYFSPGKIGTAIVNEYNFAIYIAAFGLSEKPLS